MSIIFDSLAIVSELIELKAWLSEHIEAFRAQPQLPKIQKLTVSEIANYLIKNFDECERYLNSRHPGGSPRQIHNEDDVQDLIFLILRPQINDLEWENPSAKLGGTSWRPDFDSKSLNLGIEAKFIRKNKRKEIIDEMKSDIANACNHAYCENLIFVVYDRGAQGGTKTQLKQLEGRHTHNSDFVDISVVIFP